MRLAMYRNSAIPPHEQSRQKTHCNRHHTTWLQVALHRSIVDEGCCQINSVVRGLHHVKEIRICKAVLAIVFSKYYGQDQPYSTDASSSAAVSGYISLPTRLECCSTTEHNSGEGSS